MKRQPAVPDEPIDAAVREHDGRAGLAGGHVVGLGSRR